MNIHKSCLKEKKKVKIKDNFINQKEITCKLNMQLPYDPAILLLGICLRETKS